MGICYENKIYGIRCKEHNNNNILFEIYFKVFSNVEKQSLVTFYNSLIQNNNNLDNVSFQVYKSYSTALEFCANGDDRPSYTWVYTRTQNIQDLINE